MARREVGSGQSVQIERSVQQLVAMAPDRRPEVHMLQIDDRSVTEIAGRALAHSGWAGEVLIPSLDRPSVALTTPHTGAVVDEHGAPSMVEQADVVLNIRDGEIVNVGSWVYAWLLVSGDRPVVYVGATGLHPAVRAWLHLHHEDPEVGRVIARFPAAATDPLDMLALRLPDHLSRPDTKAALIAVLAEDQLLSDHYVGDPPAPITAPAECVDVARLLVARIRAAGEQ